MIAAMFTKSAWDFFAASYLCPSREASRAAGLRRRDFTRYRVTVHGGLFGNHFPYGMGSAVGG
jgi:hypothetical protein